MFYSVISSIPFAMSYSVNSQDTIAVYQRTVNWVHLSVLPIFNLVPMYLSRLMTKRTK